jgi:hypothetical protein
MGRAGEMSMRPLDYVNTCYVVAFPNRTPSSMKAFRVSAGSAGTVTLQWQDGNSQIIPLVTLREWIRDKVVLEYLIEDWRMKTVRQEKAS